MYLHLGEHGQGYVRSGLELLGKRITAAKQALDGLGLPTLQVDAIASRHGRLLQALGDRVALAPLEFPPVLAAELRLALSLELAKLEKTMEVQQDLGILKALDTEGAIAAVRALREELNDQTTLGLEDTAGTSAAAERIDDEGSGIADDLDADEDLDDEPDA